MKTLFALASAAGALATAAGSPAAASSCGCYMRHHVHHRVHTYRAPPEPVVLHAAGGAARAAAAGDLPALPRLPPLSGLPALHDLPAVSVLWEVLGGAAVLRTEVRLRLGSPVRSLSPLVGERRASGSKSADHPVQAAGGGEAGARFERPPRRAGRPSRRRRPARWSTSAKSPGASLPAAAHETPCHRSPGRRRRCGPPPGRRRAPRPPAPSRAGRPWCAAWRG